MDLIQRGAPSETVPNRFDHLMRFTRDDFERFRPAQSLFDDMNHFRGDEVGDGGQDRSLKTKHRRDNDKDERI